MCPEYLLAGQNKCSHSENTEELCQGMLVHISYLLVEHVLSSSVVKDTCQRNASPECIFFLQMCMCGEHMQGNFTSEGEKKNTKQTPTTTFCIRQQKMTK